MQGLWAKTAASGFRMTAGTPSGRYGLRLRNRDGLLALSTRRLRVPLSGPEWWGGPSAAHKGLRHRVSFVGREDLPPYSAARVAHAGGPRIEPQPFPCSTMAWP